MTESVSEIGIAIGASGLPGSNNRLPNAALPSPEWDSLIAYVSEEQLTGLLVKAVSDGYFTVSTMQLDELHRRHQDAMVATVLLERHVVRAAELLTGAGVEYRALKGPAIAHLDYADPAQRPFGDIDLLVPQARFDDALATLVTGGYTLHPASTRLEPGARHAKGTRVVADDGGQIDLHRALVSGPVGARIHHEQFFAASSVFTLGSRPVRALGHEARLINACCEAVVGRCRPRLIALRDIAQLALSSNTKADRMREVAQETNGEMLLARGINLAWEALRLADVVALSVWAHRYRPDPSWQRALDSYLAELHTPGSVNPLRAGRMRRRFGWVRPLPIGWRT